MHFDLACSLIERHKKELVPLVRESSLFTIEAIKKSTKGIDMPYVQNDLEGLFLPLSPICLENSVQALFIKDSEPGFIGTNTDREFLLVVPAAQDKEKYLAHGMPNTDINTLELLYARYPKSAMVSTGTIHGINVIGDNLGFSITFKTLELVDKNAGILNSIKLTEGSSQVNNILKSINLGMVELLALNRPTNFVVEETSTREIKQSKSKLLRSHQRPTYTFLDLTATKIKVRNNVSQGTHASPMPHMRRRHLRVLTKEAGFKEDKVIVVKASWVGPEEYIDTNRKYRVRLDL